MHPISRRCSQVSPGFLIVLGFISLLTPRKTGKTTVVRLCRLLDGHLWTYVLLEREEWLWRRLRAQTKTRKLRPATAKVSWRIARYRLLSLISSTRHHQMLLFRFRVDPESTGPQFNVISHRQTELPALCSNLVAFTRQYIITLAPKVTKQAGWRHTE